jgi:diguanylate cyclase (GGDEF)-like protein
MVSLLPALIQGLVNSQKARDAADYDYGPDAERYLLLGCIILIVFSIFELLDLYVFRTNEVITEPDILSSFNFMELGMLFFMMCHFIYYFMNSIDHMSADRIKSQLEGLAYKDTLTGLMNRARCAQYYASLSGNFAFVSLDMDRLKYVNDNLGHLEGDKMIKSFAELLKKAFDGANLIGRTGGDEFIVVFEEPSADICDKCIRKLESLMAEFNKGDNKFTLSASAGYAYSYEIKTGN